MAMIELRTAGLWALGAGAIAAVTLIGFGTALILASRQIAAPLGHIDF
jgi:hypothetical protein